MASTLTDPTARVRALNDRLRRHRIGGLVLYTPGVLALGLELLVLVEEAITSYDEFDPDNSEQREHQRHAGAGRRHRGSVHARVARPLVPAAAPVRALRAA